MTIRIRIDPDVLVALQREASRRGVGYQTLIHQLLAKYVARRDYPNQHPGGAGLPAYVTANRSLERANVVLWYSVGSHHISRPEEWPVMPVSYAGFQLKPTGFFVGSPALDVPATSHNGRDGGHCH